MFLIVVKIWEPTVPPHGAPMEPLQGATFEKSPPAPLLTYCGMLGINCTQISARKMNPGLMQHYFEWDSHGVGPLVLPQVTLRGPRQRSPVKLMKLRHVGYQFYSDFSKKNESRVDTTLF